MQQPPNGAYDCSILKETSSNKSMMSAPLLLAMENIEPTKLLDTTLFEDECPSKEFLKPTICSNSELNLFNLKKTRQKA